MLAIRHANSWVLLNDQPCPPSGCTGTRKFAGALVGAHPRGVCSGAEPIRETQRTFVAEPLLFLPTRCIAPQKCHMLCRTESGARRAHRDAVGLAVVERTGAQLGGRKGHGAGLQRHALGWLGLRRLERESAVWPISRGV